MKHWRTVQVSRVNKGRTERRTLDAALEEAEDTARNNVLRESRLDLIEERHGPGDEALQEIFFFGRRGHRREHWDSRQHRRHCEGQRRFVNKERAARGDRSLILLSLRRSATSRYARAAFEKLSEFASYSVRPLDRGVSAEASLLRWLRRNLPS